MTSKKKQSLPHPTQQLKRFYDSQFASNSYANASELERHRYQNLLVDFIDNYNLRDSPCLEVGCGRGLFQDLVLNYVGIDISHIVGRYLRKPFVCCDAAGVPFQDECFAAIWTVNVLEHVPQPENALQEMRRVLRPGGLLFLASAWHTRPWFSQGIPVRPYSDLSVCQKISKLLLPIRDSSAVRHPTALIRRLLHYVLFRKAKEIIPLRYKRIKANYDKCWMSDSDACNSIDPFDVILWFISRGDVCLSCQTFVSQLCFRDLALVFQIRSQV